MLAIGVAVDVVRAGARHQVLGYVVDGDSVLVVLGGLIALVGDVDKSGGIDVKGELLPMYTI